jgi:hypothetical protein
MNLQDQYCTRQQALELKKLGVINKCTHPVEIDGEVYEEPVPGVFYSCTYAFREATAILGVQEDAPYDMYAPVKLYSVAELGMMIPKQIHGQGVFLSCRTFSDKGEWQATFHSFIRDAKNEHKYSAIAGTEAQARAELLILLLKVNAVNIKSVNEPLIYFTTVQKNEPPKQDDLSSLDLKL